MPPWDYRRHYGERSRPYEKAVSAFFDILARPWFRRVWVIQEVSLSKRADLICGSTTVDWDDFVEAMKFSNKISLSGLSFPQVERLIKMDLSRQDIDPSRQGILYSQGGKLLRLLFSYRDSLSTKESDKIYSLLCLVDDHECERLDLNVDYALPWQDVYRHLATTYLKAYRNLDILEACRTSAEKDMVNFLPSWVPDWTIFDAPVPLMLQGSSSEYTVLLKFLYP
jgi:hypothetical protein